ncbi:hypothetical protein Btru_037919 [Bulinus truncatus]|nr:hypothetical protein Btru_037919 [Bulinus truncatus]
MLLVQLSSDEGVYENRSEVLYRYTWVDMQNYRDPPPYPGHSKQVFSNQPGFRQSFSGSETSTDVSLSSTENLATSQRQEPQGEETQTSFNYSVDVGGCDGSSYSILERLGMPPAALDSAGKFPNYGSANSLNALSNFYQERSQPWYQSDLSRASTSLGLSSSSLPVYSKGHLAVPQWHTGQSQRDRDYSHQQQGRVATPTGDYTSSSSSCATEVTPSSLTTHSTTTRAGEYSSYFSTSVNKTGADPLILLPYLSSSSSSQYLSPRVPPVSTYHHPHPYVNTHWTVGSGDSSSSSHSSLTAFSHNSPLSQSTQSGGLTLATTAAHSGHNSTVSYLNSLPPPPEYPGNKAGAQTDKTADIRSCRSYETMDKVNSQRSHPDLRLCSSSPGLYSQDAKYQSPHGSADDSDQATIAAKASHMVEMLTDENRALREELAIYAIRVAKLQKFEMEIQKVHESHKALLKSVEKREALWQAMKRKLEEKIQSLEAQNSVTGKVGLGPHW